MTPHQSAGVSLCPQSGATCLNNFCVAAQHNRTADFVIAVSRTVPQIVLTATHCAMMCSVDTAILLMKPCWCNREEDLEKLAFCMQATLVIELDALKLGARLPFKGNRGSLLAATFQVGPCQKSVMLLLSQARLQLSLIRTAGQCQQTNCHLMNSCEKTYMQSQSITSGERLCSWSCRWLLTWSKQPIKMICRHWGSPQSPHQQPHAASAAG